MLGVTSIQCWWAGVALETNTLLREELLAKGLKLRREADCSAGARGAELEYLARMLEEQERKMEPSADGTRL
jgi:hypothetical protein